jgi:hypothetical protein
MEHYQVIFNDVPLPKRNIHWDTVYLPLARTFLVENIKELYEKIDLFIIDNNLVFSSYEIELI